MTPVGVEPLSDWLCSSLSLPLLLLQAFQLCSSYFIFRAKTNITSNLFLLCLSLTEKSFRKTVIRLRLRHSGHNLGFPKISFLLLVGVCSCDRNRDKQI